MAPGTKRRRTHDLDTIDHEILAMLEVDARVPTAEIARAVGLTAPATADRIARLRDKGIIKAFTVRLDPARLGLNIGAIVEFEPHSNADAPGLAAVIRHPAVRSCFKVTGPAMLILIVDASDGDELHDVLLDFSKHGSTKTSVILSSELADLPYFAERPRNVIAAMLKRSRTERSADRIGRARA